MRYVRGMARFAVVVCAVVALVACKKEEAAAPPKAEPATITVDGKQVAAIDPGKAGAYPPLATLAGGDLEAWRSIEVVSKGGTETIEEPATKHPGLVAALYPEAGGVALGFFAPEDAAKQGKPQWSVAGVTAVRVTTGPKPEMATGGQGGGDGAGGGEEGERPPLTAETKIVVVAADGAKTTIDGGQIAKLPTSTAPIGDTDTPGWTLGQLIELAGAEPTGKVIVYGSEGANLILEPADFDPAKATAFIKLNRSGQMRFRLFRKAGSTYDIAGELRGIDKIELK